MSGAEKIDAEQESVTVTDKRRIDPETGEARPPERETAQGAEAELEPEVVETGEVDQPEAKIAELTADLQRAHADFVNYRRRVERDRQAVIDNAKASVVTELLGVLDDLDRARNHGDLDDGPLRGVADKLVSALKSQGLESFAQEGDAFDPAIHEAVQHEGDGSDPVLGTVMRQGYKLGDRILRTAMVSVIDRPASEDASQ